MATHRELVAALAGDAARSPPRSASDDLLAVAEEEESDEDRQRELQDARRRRCRPRPARICARGSTYLRATSKSCAVSCANVDQYSAMSVADQRQPGYPRRRLRRAGVDDAARPSRRARSAFSAIVAPTMMNGASSDSVMSSTMTSAASPVRPRSRGAGAGTAATSSRRGSPPRRAPSGTAAGRGSSRRSASRARRASAPGRCARSAGARQCRRGSRVAPLPSPDRIASIRRRSSRRRPASRGSRQILPPAPARYPPRDRSP